MTIHHNNMRTLGLIIIFYKSFAFLSLMITLSCMIITYTYGVETFTVLFWFKIFTLGLSVYFINSYKRNEFLYYKNLGVSKVFLWISTLLFDSSLFIFLLIITLKIR
jgi:hypothetical protein